MSQHGMSTFNFESTRILLKGLGDRIESSWGRCVDDYQLERDARSDARIVSSCELQERQQRLEEFLRVSSGIVNTLSCQLFDLDYSVMLVDASGTALRVMQRSGVTADFRKIGLIPGASWEESRCGTSGVGTSITDRKPVLVHRGEHYLEDNEQLSCSACPIFDGDGAIIACLNVTGLNRTHSKDKELVTFKLVNLFSQMIENAYFRYCYRDCFVLNISSDYMFYDNSLGAMIAVDDNGLVVASNQIARGSLWSSLPSITGCNLDELKLINFEEISQSNRAEFIVSVAANDKNFSRELHVRVDRPEKSVKTSVGYENNFLSNKKNPKKYNHILGFNELKGRDERLTHLVFRLRQIANKDIFVLLKGETGTGKEVFAQAIHAESNRSGGPFVAVNCAAIPESLIESELFGYEAGTFTGAKRGGMKGKLLQAQGGTLFLDEIGDMPTVLQTRLLRVLSEGEVVPLGSLKAHHLDINVISATHQNLEKKIAEGSFREDLYYRLNGMLAELPSLRRRTDLEWLIRHIFQLENNGEAAQIDTAAMTLLIDYLWPGNLRELKNVARLALAFERDGMIYSDALPDKLKVNTSENTSSAEGVFATAVSGVSREQVVNCLNAHKWNITVAAGVLGISRSTLYRKIKRYRIMSPNDMSAS